MVSFNYSFKLSRYNPCHQLKNIYLLRSGPICLHETFIRKIAVFIFYIQSPLLYIPSDIQQKRSSKAYQNQIKRHVDAVVYYTAERGQVLKIRLPKDLFSMA